MCINHNNTPKAASTVTRKQVDTDEPLQEADEPKLNAESVEEPTKDNGSVDRLPDGTFLPKDDPFGQPLAKKIKSSSSHHNGNNNRMREGSVEAALPLDAAAGGSETFEDEMEETSSKSSE